MGARTRKFYALAGNWGILVFHFPRYAGVPGQCMETACTSTFLAWLTLFELAFFNHNLPHTSYILSLVIMTYDLHCPFPIYCMHGPCTIMHACTDAWEELHITFASGSVSMLSLITAWELRVRKRLLPWHTTIHIYIQWGYQKNEIYNYTVYSSHHRTWNMLSTDVLWQCLRSSSNCTLTFIALQLIYTLCTCVLGWIPIRAEYTGYGFI